MTQNQLNQLVADATGETLGEIQQRGFSLADPLDVDFDPEPDNREPLVMDWDEWEWRRDFIFPDPRLSQRKLAAGDHVAHE